MFRNVTRPIGTIVGGENQVKSLDLPRRDLYSDLILRFYLNINITTLGTPAMFAHSPAKALKRLEVIADGSQTIKSINMRALMLKNFFNWASYPRRIVPTLATGDNKFYQTVLFPFAMPRSIREIDTLIDSGRLSTFELRATFGAKTDIFVTAPTTYTMANAEIEASLHEVINVENKPITLSVYKELTIEKDLPATTNEFQVLLPVGNNYRGFLIEADVAGETVDNVINEVQVRSGTTVYFKEKWMKLRESNALRHGMESESFVGFAYIDFCPEGRLIDALPTRNLSQLEIVFDVTKQSGVNTIRIYPDEFIVPQLMS